MTAPRRSSGIRPLRLGARLLAVIVLIVGLRGLSLLPSTPAPGDPAWDARTVAQLRYLSDGLETKANAMQRLFPEGRLFTIALTGMAWADIGLRDLPVRAEAVARARQALALAEVEATRETFVPAGGLPHGMFYEAWTARLRASVVALVPEAGERGQLRASCQRIEDAFAAGPLFVDSYPGAAWPADNVVGAAALSACGDLLDERFREPPKRGSCVCSMPSTRGPGSSRTRRGVRSPAVPRRPS